ncbi:MAG: hypothetical protein WKF84_00280 [Pyrinomonadaceae bacterium]
MATDKYTPRLEHKFTFGLWTVGNRGRDPFSDAVRPRSVRLLTHAGRGNYGVNLHDNDLVPIDATPSERNQIVRDFKKSCEENNLKVPMATVNLFYDPAFRDGACRRDPAVRLRCAKDLCRNGHRRWLSSRFCAVGRQGRNETDACRRPDEAGQARLRESITSAYGR